MSALPGERRYYIDQYSDEIVPCDCTLQGWAEWLAADVTGEWGREGAHEAGADFNASVLQLLADVVVTREAQRAFRYSPPLPERFDFAALRFGAGMGWDAESVLNPDELLDGLLGYPLPNGPIDSPLLELGESGHLALGVWEPRVRLRLEYTEGGSPALRVLELVQ